MTACGGHAILASDRPLFRGAHVNAGVYLHLPAVIEVRMVLTGRRGRVEGVGLDHGITGSGVVPERSVLDAVALQVLRLANGEPPSMTEAPILPYQTPHSSMILC